MNMYFSEHERLALFIDGANLYAASKALDLDIDFQRLLAVFQRKTRLVRALYYTALVDDNEYSPVRPLIDWLDYNGYTVVTKPAKEFTDGSGRRRIKCNIDVVLTVDAMLLAETLDHIVLFSGEGHFRDLVAALQQNGKQVTVVSTLEAPSSKVADELRRQADQFIDLADLKDLIRRDPSARPSRELRSEKFD